MRAFDKTISEETRLQDATAVAAECLQLSTDTMPNSQDKAQIETVATDLQRQVNELQRERAQLLQKLQGATMGVSEQAVRFVGLTPEHIGKIRSYAMELSPMLHDANSAGEHQHIQENIKQAKDSNDM